MNTAPRLVIALFVGALSVTSLTGCGSDTIADRIGGNYQSAGCEPTPSGSFWRRYYTFTHKTWNLLLESYTDDKCMQKSISLESGGEYKVAGDPSPEGATPLDLGVAFRAATPWVKANADTLNGISCGGAKDWSAGIRKETDSGCGTITPSLVDCPTLFETATLDGTTLTLGPARAAAGDSCKAEARPTMPGAPLAKK